MVNDDITTIKVRQKDKNLMADLSCAKFGMTQDGVFEKMVSFCLQENDRLEKWMKKQKKK